jgi:hypothetical protein
MKTRNILLGLLLSFSAIASAQIVHENEVALVYYMPQTHLCVTIEYTCTQATPGPFYQYAQRYLGTCSVVTEESISYQLQQIRVNSFVSADSTRAYKVIAQKGVNAQLLSLSEDGRLLGYNIGQSKIDATSTEAIEFTSPETAPTALMPLLEEQFMAGSIAKMAEGAAKMIYRIREARLNLLASEVEQTPADGMAMQLVLKQLDEQEKALTELFVGSIRQTQHNYHVTYTPTDAVENEVFCRFSKHTGIVSKEDLSGEPIYISLLAHKQHLGESVLLDSKGVLPSQVYYNLPGQADVTISFQNQSLKSILPIAQWGVAIPLAQDYFTSKNKSTIYFNPNTGNISSIQQ